MSPSKTDFRPRDFLGVYWRSLEQVCLGEHSCLSILLTLKHARARDRRVSRGSSPQRAHHKSGGRVTSRFHAMIGA